MFDNSHFFGDDGDFYGYAIDSSLRFNDDEGAYLSWTPASNGDRQKWTWSGWVKRGNLAYVDFFSSGNGTARSSYRFNADGSIGISCNPTGTWYNNYTSALYRDCSAWYHIVLSVDTTQATATNRMRLYVNGELVTAYSTQDNIPQNSNTPENTGGVVHSIGRYEYSDTRYFDGYMAEVHFIDGTALDASSFGETKSGVWIPKAYAGSYGTNGFYLDFGNSGSIGADVSGNGNNFTANNLAATDVVLDSPTNNFATLNPLAHNGTTSTPLTLSEGNLKSTHSVTSQWQAHHGTMPVSSGKWYFEVEVVTRPTNNNQNYNIGFYDVSVYNGWYYSLEGNLTYGMDTNVGKIFVDTSRTTYGTAASSDGDIYMFALDVDNEKFWVGLNGTWMASGNPATEANPSASGFGQRTWVSHQSNYAYGSPLGVFIHNYGQDSSFAGTKTAQGNADDNGYGDFYYAPPTGYLALCTANLSVPEAFDPALDASPQDHFNTVLYTGNATDDHAITGVGFEPGLNWIKVRSTADNHIVTDVVRGGLKHLFPNLTELEYDYTGASSNFLVKTLDSDGFTLGTDNAVNRSGGTFVSWNWKANGSGVSNTDGSITSTVSANTDAGFSIATYTGNGIAGATIGHGLGASPAMIIVKTRSHTNNWLVWHQSLPANYAIEGLNTTNTPVSGGAAQKYIRSVSSTLVTVGTDGNVNQSSSYTYVMYCFAEVDGFSKIDSYTGNGSSDGPFVYTGFRPAFLLVKRTDGGTNNWVIYDKERDPYNYVDSRLFPNTTGSESGGGASYSYDFLSNGFKLRSIGSEHNISGGTYIYMAFAENPFKYANAR